MHSGVAVKNSKHILGLVVIDMSNEQLNAHGVPFNTSWEGVSNILKLASQLPKERVFDSRLWISPDDNSSLHKLYPDVGIANTDGARLSNKLKDLRATFVKKIQYSAFFGSELNQLLQRQRVDIVMLSGINTDYCVLASALDAFYSGYEVWLVEDACTSVVGGQAGHRRGIAEFKKFLGSVGKVVDTAEAMKAMGHF